MTHLEPLTISSGSMVPIINIGETVFLDRSQCNPQSGDIIAFETKDRKAIVVHRLLSIHTVFDTTYLLQSPEEGNKPTVVKFERYLGKVLLDDKKQSRKGFEWRPITKRERLRAARVFWRFWVGTKIKRWLNRK